MKAGLVLVDIQNDYFPGGRMDPVSCASMSTERLWMRKPETAGACQAMSSIQQRRWKIQWL